MSESEVRPLETGGMVYAPVGIGGWLIVPILSLVANVVAIPYYLAKGFLEGYHAGPGNARGPLHPPAQDILLAALGLFDIFFVIYAIYCVQALLRKKQDTPSLMMLFYVLFFAKTCVIGFAVFQFPVLQQSIESLSRATMRAIGAGLGMAIWISYFRVSARVKNTFTR